MVGSKFPANSARGFTQKAQSCYVGYYNPGVASTASRRLVHLCGRESAVLTLATGEVQSEYFPMRGCFTASFHCAVRNDLLDIGIDSGNGT